MRIFSAVHSLCRQITKNPASRANGLSYSKLMNGLKKAGIEINRKMLSEMAIFDAAGFADLCETAKKFN